MTKTANDPTDAFARALGGRRFDSAPPQVRPSPQGDARSSASAAPVPHAALRKGDMHLGDAETGGAIDRLGLPRWWVTKRATKLGLTMPHKKEPPWTAAEDALMSKVPLHSPDTCARVFREHGFARTPTAIMIRAKRLRLSRRFNEGLSARQAAEICGVDGKTMSTWLIAGDIVATRRADRRLPQQGGKRWIIRPDDLRRFILERLERIDLRKVDKFAFVQLIAGAS